jgi:succinate-semialdehyde dehydrogenase/glutarate-semialdehyde dehydrogenase
LKHASNVPQCSLAIEDIFKKSGFPDGAFQSLLITSSQVDEVIQNNIVKAVTLTGSEAAGSAVASSAGKAIKKSVLELGGSDPFIVFADSNLDLSIEKAVTSRLINSGQSCIAAKRFIIHSSVYQEFKDKLKHKVEALISGDPLDSKTDIGPQARADLAQDLWGSVQKSIEKGAKVVLNGQQPEEGNAYFKPMILEDVKPGMPAFDEELFGPVFSMMTFDKTEEAVALANQSKYGLGASIWSENNDFALGVASEIECGAVFINELVKSDPRVPFGGVKKSGYGRELSGLGIREFVNQKTIWLN